jgi:hypothetical protein
VLPCAHRRAWAGWDRYFRSGRRTRTCSQTYSTTSALAGSGASSTGTGRHPGRDRRPQALGWPTQPRRRPTGTIRAGAPMKTCSSPSQLGPAHDHRVTTPGHPSRSCSSRASSTPAAAPRWPRRSPTAADQSPIRRSRPLGREGRRSSARRETTPGRTARVLGRRGRSDLCQRRSAVVMVSSEAASAGPAWKSTSRDRL